MPAVERQSFDTIMCQPVTAVITIGANTQIDTTATPIVDIITVVIIQSGVALNTANAGEHLAKDTFVKCVPTKKRDLFSDRPLFLQRHFTQDCY